MSGADFSKKAVDRAVIRQTAQHPSVLYPAGAAVVGGLAALSIGPSLAILGVAAAGGLLAAGGWAVNQFFRRDKLASRYVQAMREKMMAEHSQAVEKLEHGLNEINSKPGMAQLRRAREKFDSFRTVLGSKMNPDEITFGRYLGIAEQVYFAVLDNLERVINVSRSSRAIDVDYTRKRRDELVNMNDRDSAEDVELHTLTERLELAGKQQKNIKDWLASNEQAMTQLDNAAMQLAAIETQRGRSSVNLETSMAELQRLANNAILYDRSN